MSPAARHRNTDELSAHVGVHVSSNGVVVHELKSLRIDPVAGGIDVVISGHSHVPKIDTGGGVLYLKLKRRPEAIQVADYTCDA